MPSVVDLQALDRSRISDVGGKAANLGELSRMAGLRVPPGFCVTTGAFERALAGAPGLEARIERLAGLKAHNEGEIRALSAEIREAIEAIAVPEALEAELRAALAAHGHVAAWAVRSSATAEDLATASFAGQHDTTLEVVGLEAVLREVRRCWASLFSDRAVSYRLRSGLDPRTARMAVVVQRMVAAEAAGVLFTADPLTGHRKVSVVEAVSGLGEALVSGAVNADAYEVRGGEVVARTVGEGRVLSDAQVLALAAIGRRIEAWFGRPQDVEWCLADGAFEVVQSRPITTLFPIPAAPDQDNHVYVSVGHGQMMTDAMRPLGLSFWQLTTPRPMAEAGGRLFVDLTRGLSSPTSRGAVLQAMGRSDPLIRDALQTVVERGDFLPSLPDAPFVPPAGGGGPPAPVVVDPALVTELIARSQASIAALKRDIAGKTGPELVAFILADLAELKRILFDPQSLEVVMAAIEATWWLNDHLLAWLGERGAADALAQAAPHNVTTEMGLGLQGVADAVRPYPAVLALLEGTQGEGFLDELARVEGGAGAREALKSWLDRYGMRGVGEIDITRPRFAERPSMVLPTVLGHVRHALPGAADRRVEEGRREADRKEREILERLRALPGGDQKADEARPMIERVRAYMGYREYPKYGMVSRYFVYKQALMAEAERLVAAGVLRDVEDLFFLSLPELQGVVLRQEVDQGLINDRRDAFRWHQTLTPPRVLTSDGEGLSGTYRRGDVPAGALVGLAVSAGVVEGRARVVLDLAEATLDPGDILVTTFTDPSWTPVFIGISGLVAEVGGLMTHGSVIAREVGLPAVVGVERATRLIRDGQRIRVHGTDGYVELLGD